MGNFFSDNEDLQYYVEKGIDWEPLVELTEFGYRNEDGFRSCDEALEFYRDVLDAVGKLAADEVAPRAAAIDRSGTKFVDGERRFALM